jgi:predicted dehydrogenase
MTSMQSMGIKVILIGHGYLGKWHGQKLTTHDQVQLVGIVEASAPGRVALKQVYPDIEIVEKLELLQSSFDAAFIVTPSATHGEYVAALLSEGKHVFCEKPLVTDLNQLPRIEQLLSAHPELQLHVGHSERCQAILAPLLHWINEHQWVRKIKQGEVRGFVTFYRKGIFKGRATDVSVIDDLMIHDLDLMNALFPGCFLQLSSAQGQRVRTDHWDWALARWSGGHFTVECIASRVERAEQRGLELRLADWQVYADFIGRTLEIYHRGELQGPVQTFEARDHLWLEQVAFFKAVRGQGPGGVGFESAAMACTQVEQIKKLLGII